MMNFGERLGEKMALLDSVVRNRECFELMACSWPAMASICRMRPVRRSPTTLSSLQLVTQLPCSLLNLGNVDLESQSCHAKETQFKLKLPQLNIVF